MSARAGKSALCLGHFELAGFIPSCLIHEQHGLRTLGDMARDFVEVLLHRFGAELGKASAAPIGERHRLLFDARFVLKSDFE
ncbi:MAG: hypothetical protein EXR05_03405 [Acetobacteraceae bacterium]|nr:hypothetical protein [Acetobacteraceae bacterium]MSP30192.1 hypothetical protein [Acetobacteraceae bacterium]